MNQGTICAKVYPEGIQPVKGNNCGLIPYRVNREQLPKKKKFRRSGLNQSISVIQKLCKGVGQLCFEMYILIGLKLTRVEETNSLQPKKRLRWKPDL